MGMAAVGARGEGRSVRGPVKGCARKAAAAAAAAVLCCLLLLLLTLLPPYCCGYPNVAAPRRCRAALVFGRVGNRALDLRSKRSKILYEFYK